LEKLTGLILSDGSSSSSGKRLIRIGTCDSKSWHRNKICEWQWANEFVVGKEAQILNPKQKS